MTKHTPEPLVVTTTAHQPPGYPAALISYRGGRGNGWEVIAPNVSSKAVADELAAAYNATYAAGINPEAVKDLVEALEAGIVIDDFPSEDTYNTLDRYGEWVDQARAALDKAKLP